MLCARPSITASGLATRFMIYRQGILKLRASFSPSCFLSFISSFLAFWLEWLKSDIVAEWWYRYNFRFRCQFGGLMRVWQGQNGSGEISEFWLWLDRQMGLSVAELCSWVLKLLEDFSNVCLRERQSWLMHVASTRNCHILLQDITCVYSSGGWKDLVVVFFKDLPFHYSYKTFWKILQLQYLSLGLFGVSVTKNWEEN